MVGLCLEATLHLALNSCGRTTHPFTDFPQVPQKMSSSLNREAKVQMNWGSPSSAALAHGFHAGLYPYT